jgi:SAM-dependent methyltransferase
MRVSFCVTLVLASFIFRGIGVCADPPVKPTLAEDKKRKFTCSVLGSVTSIPFYNQNAELFYQRVANPSKNLASYYERFLPQLRPSSRVLDVGCGIGRDSQYFESLGHDVTAIDGSEEMVEFSNKILKKPAKLMLFEEMDFREEFDGVWATAAFIHVPGNELLDVLVRVHKALKPGGLFFFNFKHGQGEYIDPLERRTFYYMTEDPLRGYLNGIFEVIDIWRTDDFSSSVAHSPDKMWLNALVRKNEKSTATS